ncbi:S9 family peptidase [Massilia sp. BJB1822]|uniref:alpha/beta hydrolase family protein n=1 Tax=Massilia sp. BJB1822 TaxID=2744470 RepID=UPI0015938CA3|nr:alpha/beta hydrolase [Massilia sp. BJB1822]NVD99771.1 prolyl oligopeptidase family serine peptidase [Massilia sp. BJB1822]
MSHLLPLFFFRVPSPARHAPALLLGAMLAACGGGSGTTPGQTAPLPPAPPPPPARGSLVQAASPVTVTLPGGLSATSLTPAAMRSLMEDALEGFVKLAGEPRCTVSAYRLQYRSSGLPGGALAEAGAALLLPSGSDASCSGPRPVLLYAHGTSLDKNYDMAKLTGEARMVAALFAAQGYIVVAPNYGGYAGSSLGYHPYLDAKQQANEMVDALRAARATLGTLGSSASSRLFLAGYSQGGYVALATQRAMQEAYPGEFQVAAVAGMSGPYALAQFADTIFSGDPGRGITAFLPMLSTAAQRGGAALYGTAGEMYEAQYANGIETLLPGTLGGSELAALGKLPANALFARDSLPQPVGATAFFGEPHLVRSTYRAAYLADQAAQPCGADPAKPLACAPQHPLRKWVAVNDLRNYRPASRLMLCGGHEDPTVSFNNTTASAAYFRAAGAAPDVLDLDQSENMNDPYLLYRLGFSAARLMLKADALSRGKDAREAVAESYHAGLVAPFCLLAARDYFWRDIP